ncbi:hypothetical protein PY649_34565, partial [Rhizobium mayense]|nr:hypothetical protein [Rhizobium mayense]
WLRTATRRYRRKYSNPKPLERTQNWIKLGGKVTVAADLIPIRNGGAGERVGESIPRDLVLVDA